MTKDYYKEVERTRIFFDNYKGFVRKIEHYPVYFYIGDDFLKLLYNKKLELENKLKEL